MMLRTILFTDNLGSPHASLVCEDKYYKEISGIINNLREFGMNQEDLFKELEKHTIEYSYILIDRVVNYE